MPTRTDASRDSKAGWYRQPVLWLGIAVFAFSMAGCVWLIVVSIRYADTPLPTSHMVFGVPASTSSAHRPPPRTSP